MRPFLSWKSLTPYDRGVAAFRRGDNIGVNPYFLAEDQGQSHMAFREGWFAAREVAEKEKWK